VIALSVTTYHNRKIVHKTYHTVKEQRFTFEVGNSSFSKSIDCNHRQNTAEEFTTVHHFENVPVHEASETKGAYN
jgi:hypothetical protein